MALTVFQLLNCVVSWTLIWKFSLIWKMEFLLFPAHFMFTTLGCGVGLFSSECFLGDGKLYTGIVFNKSPMLIAGGTFAAPVICSSCLIILSHRSYKFCSVHTTSWSLFLLVCSGILCVFSSLVFYLLLDPVYWWTLYREVYLTNNIFILCISI